MKKISLIFLLLCISTLVMGQSKGSYLSTDTLATLRNDTLFVHILRPPFLIEEKRYVSREDRSFKWDEKQVPYKWVVFDKGCFWVGNRKTGKVFIK